MSLINSPTHLQQPLLQGVTNENSNILVPHYSYIAIGVVVYIAEQRQYVVKIRSSIMQYSTRFSFLFVRLMSDVEVKAFDDIMQDAAKKHLGLDVSNLCI